MSNDIPKLLKQPAESRLYAMDFSANMAAADTISSITSVTATPTGLTLGTAAVSGQRVQFRISSGTGGTQYKITVVIVTSAGDTLETEGYLEVKDL